MNNDSSPSLLSSYKLYNEAIKEESKNNLLKAIELYQLALKENPNLREAYLNLGVCFSKLGKNREALKQYNQALKIKPDYDVYYNIALEFTKRKLYKEALKVIIKALKIKKDPRLYNLLGFIYLGLGEYNKSYKVFKFIIEKLNYLDKATFIGLGYSGFFSGNIDYPLEISKKLNNLEDKTIKKVIAFLKAKKGETEDLKKLVKEEEAKEISKTLEKKFSDTKELIEKRKEELKEDSPKDILAKSIMELLVGNYEKAIELLAKSIKSKS